MRGAGFAIALGYVLWAASARAVPPACFPERTVLWSAVLIDAAGNPFAGVRAGQVVHVLDDEVGPDGDDAEIEVRGALTLRGRISRSELLVFARQPIEIEPDSSWWIAEAPLWLISGNAERAVVRRAEPHGSLPRFPDADAPCALLRGTPPAKLSENSCNGAYYSSPTSITGEEVEFDKPPVLELASGRRVWIGEERYFLLERRGTRVLVETIQYYQQWVRVRGWTSAKGMKPLPADAGNYGYGHMCCEGEAYVKMERGKPTDKLLRDTDVHAEIGGPAVGSLPRRAVVQIAGAFDDQLLVVHEARLTGRRWMSASVRAWIAASAVAGPRRSPNALQGVLRYPAGSAAPTDLEVFVRAGRMPWLRGRVTGTERFEVPFLSAEEIEIKVVSGDRKWMGWVEPDPKGRELSVDVQPTREISGRITTEDGLSIPNATVDLDGSRHFDRPRVSTDASGSFGLRFMPSKRDFVNVSAPGFFDRYLIELDQLPAQLKLSRVRVVAGAVPRDAAGRCIEQEILSDEGHRATTRADCGFALVREGPGALTVRGRWHRGVDVTLNFKGESPYSGACPPDEPQSTEPSDPERQLRCDASGDVMDVCVGRKCAPATRASVFARVVTRDALAADSKIEAFDETKKLGECSAPSGACVIHDLPAGVPIRFRSTHAGRELSTSTIVRAGTVTEVSLR